MRLLLANPYFHPHLGGIEARMRGLARELARRHEVAVLTARLPGTAEEERLDGFTVLRCPAVVWRSFPYNPPPVWTRGILAELESWNPEVADFQYRWAPKWTRAMEAWARKHATVFTWHNPYGEGQGFVRSLSEWNDARFLRSLEQVRRVVCISESVRRDLAARGIGGSKLCTIYPGFGAPPEIGHEEERDHAVFIGRLVGTKGLDVLLEALALAPKVRVTLIGKGPERGNLEARARRLGVEERVRFAGFISEEEKARLTASARFVVHPSRWEGFGHALTEAMLLGKPVLATDVGGVAEAVGPGGILVPANDPPALARAMAALWQDKPLREALGAKALQHARTFTWERCARQTEEVYSEALGLR